MQNPTPENEQNEPENDFPGNEEEVKNLPHEAWHVVHPKNLRRSQITNIEGSEEGDSNEE